jgi:hypothetical protein
MTHPERYSEAFVVKTVVLPLLKVLCHMHDNRIVHRWVEVAFFTPAIALSTALRFIEGGNSAHEISKLGGDSLLS